MLVRIAADLAAWLTQLAMAALAMASLVGCGIALWLSRRRKRD